VSDLPHAVRRVLFHMRKYPSATYSGMFAVSYTELARAAEVSRPTVISHIKLLSILGAVKVFTKERGFELSSSIPCIYSVDWQRVNTVTKQQIRDARWLMRYHKEERKHKLERAIGYDKAKEIVEVWGIEVPNPNPDGEPPTQEYINEVYARSVERRRVTHREGSRNIARS
jgi:DNA-binding transcriptional ArsR family regulator